MKLKLLFIVFAMGLFISSCSTDAEDDVFNTANFSAENETKAAQIDASTDLSFNIVENAFQEQLAADGLLMRTSFFPECASITFSPNGDGTGNIVIDFGDGCTLNNGDFVQGRVVIDYRTPDDNTRNIVYSYEEFFINSRGVSGGGTAVRMRENANGNPQALATEDIAVTFPNSDITGTRTATRLREWIEGVDSNTWTDNVYEISGNWNTQLSNGFTRNGETVQNLRRELSCPVFVSGTLDITQNGNNALLDYGDGTCDAIATLTYNGIEYTIRVGN